MGSSYLSRCSRRPGPPPRHPQLAQGPWAVPGKVCLQDVQLHLTRGKRPHAQDWELGRSGRKAQGDSLRTDTGEVTYLGPVKSTRHRRDSKQTKTKHRSPCRIIYIVPLNTDRSKLLHNDLIYTSLFRNTEAGYREGCPGGLEVTGLSWRRDPAGFALHSPQGLTPQPRFTRVQDRQTIPGTNSLYLLHVNVLHVSFLKRELGLCQ